MKLNIFNKVSSTANCLIGIKRKERLFINKIKEYKSKGVVIDLDILIKDLHQIVDILLKFNPKHVVIVNSKSQYNQIFSTFTAINEFTLLAGKYKVGTFTNPLNKSYIELGCLISIHDKRDQSAIKEAKGLEIPVIGLTNLSRGCKVYDKFALINTFSPTAVGLVTWYITNCLQEKKNKTEISFQEYFNICNIPQSNVTENGSE
jgi:ribosomal protein S2